MCGYNPRPHITETHYSRAQHLLEQSILQAAETVPEPKRSFPARAAFRTNRLG